MMPRTDFRRTKHASALMERLVEASGRSEFCIRHIARELMAEIAEDEIIRKSRSEALSDLAERLGLELLND